MAKGQPQESGKEGTPAEKLLEMIITNQILGLDRALFIIEVVKNTKGSLEDAETAIRKHIAGLQKGLSQ